MVLTLDRSKKIRSWRQFAREVRSKNCNLLKELHKFPDSILVTGCQRSGTTMLSRIISQSEGMVNFWVGKDDELDGAVILSGQVKHNSRGRHCFQTTYLNECYYEYFDHCRHHKIIWVLRNPFSVVYSMRYNWTRFALNELFVACGSKFLSDKEKGLYDLLGGWVVNRTRRSCLSYNGKLAQLLELKEKIDTERFFVIEYEELVGMPHDALKKIYRFIDLPYKSEYAQIINKKSQHKRKLLSNKDYQLVENLCQPIYEKAKSILIE